MSGFKSYYTGPMPHVGSQIQLNKDESHHLISVLRARERSIITLFDGTGRSWNGTLTEANPKQAVVKIESSLQIPLPSCKIILAQAMPKGKGMEQIIQKATEIGISKIIPIKTARTELKLDGERQEKRIERWHTTAVEACKQSGNLLIPEITPVQSIKEFLESIEDIDCLKLNASLEQDAQPLKSYLKDTIPSSIVWLIGPEGDFTQNEYQMARESGFLAISLAKNVLRIETAVIYALSITDYEINNFDQKMKSKSQ